MSAPLGRLRLPWVDLPLFGLLLACAPVCALPDLPEQVGLGPGGASLLERAALPQVLGLAQVQRLVTGRLGSVHVLRRVLRRPFTLFGHAQCEGLHLFGAWLLALGPLALSGCSFRPFPGLSLVLEIHIAHILDARGIEYEAQAKTENGKKPDFLFPSQAAYEDPAFPEEQLRMLASKTSIKDRFRQVADEANRIRDKHLFTLTPGDVTHPKLAQLDELHIHLVMPKVVKESYDDLIQGETMTFSRFIEEIQGLQADRPQSLTLL